MTINTTTELSTLTGNWVLDPHRTTIEFRTKMLGIFPVKGAFQAHQGRGQLAVDGTVDGSLVIDAASVNTGAVESEHRTGGQPGRSDGQDEVGGLQCRVEPSGLGADGVIGEHVRHLGAKGHQPGDVVVKLQVRRQDRYRGCGSGLGAVWVMHVR